MADKLIQIRPSLAAVRDHSRQFADFTFVYPVISRRSGGLSLGLNLNPNKICNFDCIYCEVDRRVPGTVSRVDLNQMRDELIAMIRFAKDGGLAREPKFDEVPWLTREIKDIAFSGDGEPTMVHNFFDCARMVTEVKQLEGLNQTRIVLVTDGAGLDKTEVERGLELMDGHQGVVWAKLDAGTEDYFRRINRTEVRFDRILSNLLQAARKRPIVIQSLFLKIDGMPMGSEELDAYCSRLNEMQKGGGQIREVHAYTVARPTASAGASPLSAEELGQVARAIQESTGLAVRAFD